MAEHPSLQAPKPIAETVTPVEAIDLSKVEAKALHITEMLNKLVETTEAELDSIEQRVLELVAKRLEREV
jgi:hypothetical protein